MIKVCPLFSGSSGNSTYIGNENEGILIDAGKNAKQIELALKKNEIDVNSIKAIFVTHEHNDHVSGIRVFASRYGLEVFGSDGTVEALENMGIVNGKYKCSKLGWDGTKTQEMRVKPFKTSHDSKQSVGYTVEFRNGEKVAVCTDLGFVSEEVENSLKGCRAVVLESNHDVELLKNGCYPYFLKRRILSDKGHLSNESCAKFALKLMESGTKNFILSHLSRENNLPEIAYQTVLNSFTDNFLKEDKDFTLSVAPVFNEGDCCVCI